MPLQVSGRPAVLRALCAVRSVRTGPTLDVLEPAVAPKLIADLGTDNWNLRNFLEEGGLPAEVSASASERAAAYQTVVAVKCRRSFSRLWTNEPSRSSAIGFA